MTVKRSTNEDTAPIGAGVLASRLPALTPREREALSHMLNAAGPKDTARSMGVTPGTSSKLRSRVLMKLNVDSAESAILRFAQPGDGFDRVVMSPEDIARIESLERTERFLRESERFLLSVIRRHLWPASPPTIPDFPELTQRENEVLRELLQGRSNTAAGQTLGISRRTVEQHRARILAKLGARSRADLARLVVLRMQGGGRRDN
jgi:DNA-binding CsgD family transcriptional regulator